MTRARIKHGAADQLYVLEDEHGDLFLAGKQVCDESTSPVLLEDQSLWDAYVVACNALNLARRRVIDALQVPPSKPTTAPTKGPK